MFEIGELKHLASYSARITKNIEFGETPAGRRMDVYFEGELTGEQLSGSMSGVDYVAFRSDGTFEINVWGVITTNDGALISTRIEGYSRQKDGSIVDTVRVLTSDDRYKWLCDKLIVGWGRVMDTSEGQGFNVDYYYEP